MNVKVRNLKRKKINYTKNQTGILELETIIEIKISLGRFNSRLEMAERNQ